MWRPILNRTFDGNNGYSLNVSMPDVSGSLLCVREGEFVIGGTSGNNQVGQPLVLGNLWADTSEYGGVKVMFHSSVPSSPGARLNAQQVPNSSG